MYNATQVRGVFWLLSGNRAVRVVCATNLVAQKVLSGTHDTSARVHTHQRRTRNERQRARNTTQTGRWTAGSVAFTRCLAPLPTHPHTHTHKARAASLGVDREHTRVSHLGMFIPTNCAAPTAACRLVHRSVQRGVRKSCLLSSSADLLT